MSWKTCSMVQWVRLVIANVHHHLCLKIEMTSKLKQSGITNNYISMVYEPYYIRQRGFFYHTYLIYINPNYFLLFSLIIGACV